MAMKSTPPPRVLLARPPRGCPDNARPVALAAILILSGYFIGRGRALAGEDCSLTPRKSLIAVKTRDDIPGILEREKLESGVELGVQAGVYAEVTLSVWKSCRVYYLVDLWAQQREYKDTANVDDSAHEELYQQTRARLDRWQNRTKFLRMSTVEAADHIPDGSLDYVYVDARHDYCGAREDLEAFWPKLRRGGILAGHDYLDAADQRQMDPNQDWTVCANGTVHPGAVKGAVDEFADRWGLTVAVTYRDHPSYMMRKP